MFNTVSAPTGAPVTLIWRKETWRHAPGFLWRLYAPKAVLEAIGGAPCTSYSLPGLIGTVAKHGRAWNGRAELTPYDSVKSDNARDCMAKAALEGMISAHLAQLGLVASFEESATTPPAFTFRTAPELYVNGAPVLNRYNALFAVGGADRWSLVNRANGKPRVFATPKAATAAARKALGAAI